MRVETRVGAPHRDTRRPQEPRAAIVAITTKRTLQFATTVRAVLVTVAICSTRVKASRLDASSQFHANGLWESATVTSGIATWGIAWEGVVCDLLLSLGIPIKAIELSLYGLCGIR